MDTIAPLESWRWPLAAILLAANIAVWVGVYLEKEEFPSITKAAGRGMLLRGLAIETMVVMLLFMLDTVAQIKSNEEVAKTQAGTELLRSANLQIQKALAPRRLLQPVGYRRGTLLGFAFKFPLSSKFPGIDIKIQVVPDIEAMNLATDIRDLLALREWNIDFVGIEKTGLEPTEMMEGVSVFSGRLTLSPDMDRILETDPGAAIAKGLRDLGVRYVSFENIPPGHRIPGVAPRVTPPITSVFILVGSRPITREFQELNSKLSTEP